MKRKLIFLAAALAVLAACGKDPNDSNEHRRRSVPAGTVKTGFIPSVYMAKSLNYTVWLPKGYDEKQTYPFLYLLHGYGDDNTSWNLKGGANRIADEYIFDGGVPMVIIMPDGLQEFYVGKYESYMHEELMPKVEQLYHCNGLRAVAGLSMGGYGTLYNVLKYPEKYTYGYAMSPASDLNSFSQLAVAHSPSEFPLITIESGTGDQTVSIQSVRNCVEVLRERGLEIDFIERSGGHDWKFWPVCLEKALVAIGETFK